MTTLRYCPVCFNEVPQEDRICPFCKIDIPMWSRSIPYTSQLIHALNNPHSEVRMGAILSLGKRGVLEAARPVADCALHWPTDVVQGLKIVRAIGLLPPLSRAEGRSGPVAFPSVPPGQEGYRKDSTDSIEKQFQIWQRSPHARAYRDLGSPEAMTIARKLKIVNPQKNQRCLYCHTTAAGTPLPDLISTFRLKDGVQCESCHSPREDYAHYNVMIDPVKSREAGLTIHPDEKTCKTCHNLSSPTFKGFDYQQALAWISHPIPKKERMGHSQHKKTTYKL